MYRTLLVCVVQYPAERRRKEGRGGKDGGRLSLLLSLMEFLSRIEHGQKKADEIYVYIYGVQEGRRRTAACRFGGGGGGGGGGGWINKF